MPMGIVSDKDFRFEINRTSQNPKSGNIQKPVVTIHPPSPILHNETPGRKEGDVNVPDSLRNLIGITSVSESRADALELASSLGISKSSVSAYANGAKSTASYNETPNKPNIDDARERVSKRARGKLMLALSKITADKLDYVKARDLAGIAKDMSTVMKHMEPPKDTPLSGNNGPTFVFYSPKVKSEESFEVVHAKE